MLQETIKIYIKDSVVGEPPLESKDKYGEKQESKNGAVVPKLPALQLKSDNNRWSADEAFDSVHDFCTTFEKILRAHNL